MLKHAGRSDLELHASPIRSGKGIWRGFTKNKREAILIDTLNYIKENYPRQFILFGAVINNSNDDVPEELFSQLTSRFDKYEYNDDTYYSIIKDCFDKDNNKQHGLYVLEKK